MTRLPARWMHPVFTILMALMMSGVMTLVMTVVNFGFTSQFLARWLKMYAVGFSVAVPAIYVLAPLARRLALCVVEPVGSAPPVNHSQKTNSKTDD